MDTREAELLAKINQGLPKDLTSRYHELIQKRRSGIIDAEEYAELLRLTDEVEILNAQRIEEIAELAQLRGTSLANMVEQLRTSSDHPYPSEAD